MVDDGSDDSQRKRKLEQVPICTEKRRKLFVRDYMCDQPLDWDQARELHRSIFAPLKIDIPDNDFGSIVSTYIDFKTSDDRKESADVLAVIVPGPPLSTVQNKCAEQVFKGLVRAHRSQPPKLGRIELSRADLLTRVKAKSSSQGSYENYIIFTSEKKLGVPRQTMEVPWGDTFFNRWTVPLIPFSRLHRVNWQTYMATFLGQESAPQADPASPEDSRTGDEVALTDEQRIPCPHEHDVVLCRQMIKVRC